MYGKINGSLNIVNEIEKYGELGRDDALTLFRNQLKRCLTCRKIGNLQTYYLLSSIIRLAVL